MIPLLLLLLLWSLTCSHAFVPILRPPTVIRKTGTNTRISLQETTTPASASTTDAWATAWNEGGKVSVRVVQHIENSTIAFPDQAVDAWLEHHWKKGGGLPIFVRVASNATNNERKRIILPLGMQETYEHDKANSTENSSTICYTVSKSGPFFAHLVPNSHQGTVQFLQVLDDQPRNHTSKSIQMIWEVEFETTRYRPLYQAVTEFTIGVAARTVAEALGPSRLLTVRATLPAPRRPEATTNITATTLVEEVLREWLEFFWARGGGLLLPPPISFGPVLPEGGGTARRSILRIPPCLVDTVLSMSTTSGGTSMERSGATTADAVYQIENPGWTTFPFLIHTHLGRAQFMASSDKDVTNSVEIVWQIQIRPFSLVAPLVETLLEMTATTIVRNLAVHLREPEARVVLQPPRGKTIQIGDSIQLKSLGSISKASWLGSVLDEHVKDTRSTWDQTMSLFQPWTWGRSKDAGSPGDIVTAQWTDGEIELNEQDGVMN